MPFVELDHHVQRPPGSSLVGILEHLENKVLQLSVDVDNLVVVVQLLKVEDDDTVQELPQLLIFAPEKLKEYRKHYAGSNYVLASHDFETCDQGQPNRGIKDGEILLEDVDELPTEELSQLALVNPTHMSHEFAVVFCPFVFLGRIFFQGREKSFEDLKVCLELFLVHVGLSFYFVLQRAESHVGQEGLFVCLRLFRWAQLLDQLLLLLLLGGSV